jgi:hypothetical protein
MTFPHVIDQSRRLAIVMLSGPVHGHEITAGLENLYRDEQWTPAFDLLWDARNITELHLDMADLTGLVRLHKQYGAVGPRREVTLVRRPLDRTMARIYAILMKAASHQVHVCESEAEANEWLAKS